MTGGQQVGERPEGHSVIQISHSIAAEGVTKQVVVTDEPEKYAVAKLPPGVEVRHRDELDAIQREFREIAGTTAIIYDQTCATEKRPRRKRGKMVDPAVRVVINDLVCEGCGDCSVKSNCLSVEPLETEFGRKRTINQSSCNKDTSCLKGFCPSFVTVEGGKLKAKQQAEAVSLEGLPALPEPRIAPVQGAYGIVVAGVGGTGVITIGQLLGMAAHIEGKGIVTQDAAGLAQKGGATWSHVIIGESQDAIRTTRVNMAGADAVIGCDPIVAAGKETVLRMRPGRTRVALNGHSTPTAAFVKNANWTNPADACTAEVAKAVGENGVAVFNADLASTKLLGDSIYTNPMMLGFAWQKGWVPLAYESLMRAIELNGVTVDKNKAAFEWGRRAAHDWPSVEKLITPAQVIELRRRDTVETLVARRAEFLEQYQNASYAKHYTDFVERVRQAEAPLGKTVLTESVARYLFKLMAYKDEYEVARLYTQTGFEERIAAMFEGAYKVNFHLAPPAIARRNDKGELVKQKFGPWTMSMFKVLARLKALRGTALDPFGRTEERRTERALIGQYRASIEQVLAQLSAANHPLAVEIARIPEQIKGFGHVKERNLHAARQRWDQLMQQWSAGGVEQRAA
jgi:indolepyruvate ferredoxin oxidoreductase